MMITSKQVKEARKLLGWTREALGGHVGVSGSTIGLFERNGLRLPQLDLAAVRQALEAANIEFPDRASPRLKRGRDRARRRRRVFNAPIFPDLRAMISARLADFPDALVAVIQGLHELENRSGPRRQAQRPE